MSRRSGVTLVEVLVAIFVMGIGMIALLTLFPIGVLRMQQAINDELAAQAGTNAQNISIVYNLRNDPGVVGAPDVFINPFPPAAGGALQDADPYGESYAIFVDPIGANSGATSPWVGGAFSKGILLRRSVSFAAGPTIYSNFTLWDDMAFNSDPALGFPGTPEVAGTAVMRNSRFSWGYTLRRPVTSDRSVVECSVVVFNSRPLSLTSNLTLGEFVYSPAGQYAGGGGLQGAYFNPNSNTIAVYYNQATGPVAPPIRPGNWVLDATQYLTKNSAGAISGGQHAYWYRVLSTQDVNVAGNTFAVFEIQGQIRGFNNFSNWVTLAPGNPSVTAVVDPTNGSAAYQGTLVIMDGVAEVFEKGPGRTP